MGIILSIILIIIGGIVLFVVLGLLGWGVQAFAYLFSFLGDGIWGCIGCFFRFFWWIFVIYVIIALFAT